ncbi:MAG: iron-sulfur cluster assembly scaffold protein [Proteobacteria bacterium]|nr:iron-sulfur cluster assembly scaffold protein [Pseudomonadota bacterium]
MSDALYHDAILARAKDTAREGRIDGATRTATRDNPLCGDRVTFDFTLDGTRIAAVRHLVRGCALCRASAALLAAQLEGHDAAQIGAAATRLEKALAGENDPADPEWQVFAPVGRHKSRHDCVRLPFAAARAAFEA